MEKISIRTERSKNLLRWYDQRINGLEVLNEENKQLSVPFFDIAIEHHKSIILLIEYKFFGSAFSLVRVLLESYVKGLWIFYCAGENDFKSLEASFSKKKLYGMVCEIEKMNLSLGIKNEYIRAMNSYVHSGLLQVCRRFKNNDICLNYGDDEVIEILNFSDAIGFLSVFHIALISNNIKFINELIDISRKELKIY